jgi:hypothetical protein
VDEVAWEVEARPVAPEHRAAPAAHVGHLDDQETARRQPAEHVAERAGRIGQVLDDVEGRDEVERAGRLRDVGGIAHRDVLAHRAGLGGRLRIELDATHTPADRRHLLQEATGGAAHVEEPATADPGREVLHDLASPEPGAGAVGEPGAGGVQVGIAEPAGQHPAHGERAVPEHPSQVGVARVGRIVGRVHAVELVAAHARILVEQAAALTAGQGKAPGHAQGQVPLGAQHGGLGRAAQRAGDRLQLERARHDGVGGAVSTTVNDLPATKRSLACSRNS